MTAIQRNASGREDLAPRTGAGQRRQGGASGQAMVELALVLPFLALLLVLALDVGRVYAAYTGIRGMAEYGARYAAYYPTDSDAQIIDKTNQEHANTLEQARISVVVTSPRTSGNEVTVTVRYRFSPITPFVGGLWGGGDLAISASASTVVMQ